jgi:hypothetical protein
MCRARLACRSPPRSRAVASRAPRAHFDRSCRTDPREGCFVAEATDVLAGLSSDVAAAKPAQGGSDVRDSVTGAELSEHVERRFARADRRQRRERQRRILEAHTAFDDEAAVPAGGCAAVAVGVEFGDQKQERKGVAKVERLRELSCRRLSGEQVSTLDRPLEVRVRRTLQHERMFAQARRRAAFCD